MYRPRAPVGELVVELRRGHELRVEVAESSRRDRRRLLEPVQPGVELLRVRHLPRAVSRPCHGIRPDCEQHERLQPRARFPIASRSCATPLSSSDLRRPAADTGRPPQEAHTSVGPDRISRGPELRERVRYEADRLGACPRARLWRGEPGRVPVLRQLRSGARTGRGAAGGAEDGDGRLLRCDRVDGARRAARSRGDAAHDGPLLRGDPADRRAARRHGGEVHRRRGDGGVRHPRRARGRRAAGRARGGGDPRAADGARRRAVGRASRSAPASTRARSSPARARRSSRATPSTSPPDSSRRRRQARS